MGREAKRVPMGFDWPIGKVWWGYDLDPVPCQTCAHSGRVTWERAEHPEARDDGGWYCPDCDGDLLAYARIEVPDGPGWQMWETTSEGAPMSPVFETSEDLARWLADTGASSFGSGTASYDEWLSCVMGEGWTGLLVSVTPEGIVSEGPV